MSKFLIRFITLALIPCLISEPVKALSLTARPANHVTPQLFETTAMADAALWVTHLPEAPQGRWLWLRHQLVSRKWMQASTYDRRGWVIENTLSVSAGWILSAFYAYWTTDSFKAPLSTFMIFTPIVFFVGHLYDFWAERHHRDRWATIVANHIAAVGILALSAVPMIGSTLNRWTAFSSVFAFFAAHGATIREILRSRKVAQNISKKWIGLLGFSALGLALLSVAQHELSAGAMFIGFIAYLFANFHKPGPGRSFLVGFSLLLAGSFWSTAYVGWSETASGLLIAVSGWAVVLFVRWRMGSPRQATILLAETHRGLHSILENFRTVSDQTLLEFVLNPVYGLLQDLQNLSSDDRDTLRHLAEVENIPWPLYEPQTAGEFIAYLALREFESRHEATFRRLRQSVPAHHGELDRYARIARALNTYGYPLFPHGLLEIGPGAGEWLLSLKLGWYHNVEFLDKSLTLPWYMAWYGIRGHRGNILSVPYSIRAQRYGIIVSRNVLDLLISSEEGLTALKNMRTLLRVGGLCILQVAGDFPFEEKDLRTLPLELLEGSIEQHFLILRAIESDPSSLPRAVLGSA